MHMYIYKIHVTPATARLLHDAQAMHAALCEMAGQSREQVNLLWALDVDHGYLRVQSDIPLSARDDFTLVGTLDLNRQQKKYINGAKIHFLLTTDFCKKRDGKRVYITNPSEMAANLMKRLEKKGLDVEQLELIQKRTVSFSHPVERGGNASITVWDIDVVGTITNADLFWEAWRRGIGRHRAYGNGLPTLKN